MRPLANLVNRQAEVTEPELHDALDTLFLALRRHPVNEQLRELTRRLRDDNILPNEESTENLLRFLIDQVTARSVIPIPDQVTDSGVPTGPIAFTIADAETDPAEACLSI